MFPSHNTQIPVCFLYFPLNYTWKAKDDQLQEQISGMKDIKTIRKGGSEGNRDSAWSLKNL